MSEDFSGRKQTHLLKKRIAFFNDLLQRIQERVGIPAWSLKLNVEVAVELIAEVEFEVGRQETCQIPSKVPRADLFQIGILSLSEVVSDNCELADSPMTRSEMIRRKCNRTVNQIDVAH